MTTVLKGDTFIAQQDIKRTSVGSYSEVTIAKGTLVQVTSNPTRTGTFNIRGKATNRWGEYLDYSVIILKHEVSELLGADEPEGMPRKLGEVPEGMISPDDPRLAWLWEDAAAVANRANHCSEYDKLCDQLNIPGREREFTVTRKLGEMRATFKTKARSRRAAETLVDAQLKTVVS